MSKRKYSYLIYKDGKKERIFNWLDSSNRLNKMIVVLTLKGTYLYLATDPIRDDHPDYPRRSNLVLLEPHHTFYKLKEGVHYIDIYNADLWYAVPDIDRMELVITNE